MNYVADIATLLDSIRYHYEVGQAQTKEGISTIKSVRPVGKVGTRVRARRPQIPGSDVFRCDNCLVLEDMNGRKIGNITIDKQGDQFPIFQVRVRMFGQMRASRFHEKQEDVLQELYDMLDYFCLIVVSWP